MSWRRLLVVAVLLAGCAVAMAACGDYEKHLVGPYYLFAHEDMLDLSLVRQSETTGVEVGRVLPVVVDVGWDEGYVVVSRRYRQEPGGELMYYYINIAEDGPGGLPEEGVRTGPLTLQEFEAAKAALGLPMFTLHYSQLR